MKKILITITISALMIILGVYTYNHTGTRNWKILSVDNQYLAFDLKYPDGWEISNFEPMGRIYFQKQGVIIDDDGEISSIWQNPTEKNLNEYYSHLISTNDIKSYSLIKSNLNGIPCFEVKVYSDNSPNYFVSYHINAKGKNYQIAYTKNLISDSNAEKFLSSIRFH